jgi:nitroreductase
MEHLPQLNWRYATKRMTGQKLTPNKLEIVLEAIRLAPTSLGLQPLHVFIVSSDAMKAKIAQQACKQPQVTECSQLLVFCCKTQIHSQDVQEYIALIAKTREVPTSSLGDFEKMIQGFAQSQSPEKQEQWATKQAYIALGFGLYAAALEQIDATPMEGFDSPTMDEVLGLEKLGLRSCVLLALGFRNAETDFLVKAKKVRKEKQSLFTTV